jgi:uncharacterized membrane protein
MDASRQDELLQLQASARQLQQELNAITRHLETLAEVRVRVRQLEQSIQEVNRRMRNLAGPEAATPPPLPPLPKAIAAPPPPPAPDWQKMESTRAAAQPLLPPPPPAAPLRPVEDSTVERSGFEMAVGSYWLVGLGVIFLLATLVFAGNYAYKQWILGAGPVFKISLMLVVCALVTGVAVWLERAHESLVNYARMVGAGGLAGFYYTIYAAHYVPALQVIQSPVIAAALLLAWSAVIIALAEWKQSEILAVFAIALAFFTTSLNPIGYFSLFTNLILTVAAVVFLVRNRWAYVTYVSLLGTYLGFLVGQSMEGGASADGSTLWVVRLGFILAYWSVYTFAVFSSRTPEFEAPQKIGFSSVNNAALVGLAWIIAPQAYEAHTLVGCGLLLLGTTLWVRPVLGINSPLYVSYLVQALTITTAGLVAELSGPVLAIALVAECLILLVRGVLTQNLLCRVGAHLCGAAGFVATLAEMDTSRLPDLALGAFVSLAFLFAMGWLYERRGREETVAGFPGWAESYFYGALGMICGLVTIYQQTTDPTFAPVLAAVALALMAVAHALELPALLFYAQGYLILAQGDVIFSNALSYYPWWNPLAVLAVTVGAKWYWEQVGSRNAPDGGFGRAISAIHSLATLGLIYAGLQPLFAYETWIVVASVLSIVLLFAGVILRDPFLAGGSQLFLFSSIIGFIVHAGTYHLSPAAGLVPLAALAGTAWCAEGWIRQCMEEDSSCANKLFPIGVVSRIYRVLALILALCWIQSYIPYTARGWFYMTLGFIGFLANGFRMDNLRFALTGIFSLFGWYYLVLEYQVTSADNLLNWLGVVMLLAQEPLHENFVEEKDEASVWPKVTTVAALWALWTYLGRVIYLENLLAYKTMLWALLALACFAGGFLLRLRSYRLTGLFILSAAILRVICVDVWKFNDLLRIVTFAVLAAVLLGLGLVYNRYRDSMRKWL